MFEVDMELTFSKGLHTFGTTPFKSHLDNANDFSTNNVMNTKTTSPITLPSYFQVLAVTFHVHD